MDFKKKKELTESELLMVEYQPLMYMNMEKFDQLGKMKYKRTMNKCINDILRPDTYIYGFGINGEKHELYLDIDYIYRIVKKENYLFDIAPSTIVFVNVWDISIQLDTNENIIIDNVDVEYLGVPRNSEYVKSESEYKVSIECLQGMLSFCTIGGHLIKREQEVTIEKEHIEISSLRPICFSQEGEMQNIKLTNQVDRGGL
jgi:hypothetical protein